jgi:hypothetical protein
MKIFHAMIAGASLVLFGLSTALGAEQTLGQRVREAAASRPFACTNSTLSCNRAVSGELGPSDCTFTVDGTYFDVWLFQGTAGNEIDITLTPLDDSYTQPRLLLLPPSADASKTPTIGANTRALHMSYILASSGTWEIAVGTSSLTSHGRYTLQLSCSPDPSPSDPQNCIEQTLDGCPYRMFWNLTASGCRFSDGGGPYQYVSFKGYPGDTYAFTASSVDFTPAVAVYSFDQSAPLTSAFAQPGSPTITLNFSPGQKADYFAIVVGRTTNSVGEFIFDASCNLACVAPTITAKPSPIAVSVGTAVNLVVSATGSGVLSYRWYDTAEPFATLSSSVQLLTQKLSKTTTFGVDVTGDCGSVHAEVTVTVQQPARRRAVHH